jgi:hypothetical protein
MTTTAPQHESPPAPQRLWSDILTTPVGDLLRGRIGARCRPRPRDLIATCGLPAELASLVWEVVRRTRLWSTEKVAVSRELIAHFEDGLAVGTSAAELGVSFGDPAQAAALIRRAKRRNRPLIWKAAKLAENAVAAVLSLALLLYTIQVVRLYSHAPNITRNYVSEWNQDALTVPPAERAWPVYLAAMQATNGYWEHNWHGDELSPGSSSWPDITEFINSNGRALELYRQAAAMPKIGLVLGREPDVDYMVNNAGQPIKNAGAAPDPNPEFISVLLPPLTTFRSVSGMLKVDVYLAAQAGDAQRTQHNLDAVFGIVAHAREVRLMLADLVALTIAGDACRTIGALLRANPQLFDDHQLAQIAHRLAGLGGPEGLRTRFASERATVEDFLQRYFTDDGHGDGLGRPELLARLAVFTSGDPAPTRWTPTIGLNTVLMPAISPFMAGKREMLAKCLDFFGRYEAEAATPLWQRSPTTVDDEFIQFRTSLRNEVRYAPLMILMPSLGRAGLMYEYFAQQRDATTAALALALYHRQHGSWPQSLNELVPQLLPQVPPDRYDGQPLKYCLVDGHPLLYSIGVNRKDDGGRLPSPPPDGTKTPLAELNRQARRWQPAPTAQRGAGAAMEKPLPDGDWLLWPPVE